MPSRHRYHEAGRGDNGFGLIEVMISMVILLIGTIPIGYLLTSITQQSVTARARITAIGIAEHWLEYYNNLALDNSAGTFPTPGGVVNTNTSTVGSNTYKATISMQWGQTGVNGNLCNSGSVPQIIDVLAQVTWGQGNSVQESTVANPPYGLVTPTTGFLAVQVDDAAGKGQSYTPPAQPINVAFSSTQSAQGAQILGTPPTVVPEGGCIFVEAASGFSYTVTLSSPTSSPFSYVDDGENTTTSVPVDVPSEGTGLGSVTYDQGGAINVNYASQTSLADGVTCPLSGTCFTLGRETQGALVLEDSSGSWSSVTLPAGVLSGVSGIACLSAAQCVLTGFGPSGSSSTGVLLGLNPTSGTTSQIALPTGVTATDLTSVSCPTSGTTCIVTGTAGGTAGVLLTTNGTTATNVMPTLTIPSVTSLNGSACSSATQCFAVGTGIAFPTHVGVVLAGSGTTWALQSIPTTPTAVTAINNISCSTQAGASPFMCTAGVTAGGPTLLSTVNGGTTWSLPTTTLANVGQVGQLACLNGGTCMAALEQITGSTSTGGVAISTDGGTTWTASTGFPSGVGALSALSCTSSAQCLAVGSNASGAFAAVWNGTTWAASSVPGSSTFASGAACDTATHCVAVGESPTGPIAYVVTNSSGSWSWSTVSGNAPAGIDSLTGTGLTASGLPLTYQNVQFAGNTQVGVPYTTSTAANPTVIGNLFPFVGATGATYSVWSGDCPANQPDSSYQASTLVASGQYAPSSSTSLTVPLSYLALRIVDQNGQPLSGATVTAQVTTSGCSTDTFALPSSQGDGMVEAGLPMGASGTPLDYTITGTSGANTGTVQLAVSATGVQVSPPSGTTVPYPIPVTLAVS